MELLLASPIKMRDDANWSITIKRVLQTAFKLRDVQNAAHRAETFVSVMKIIFLYEKTNPVISFALTFFNIKEILQFETESDYLVYENAIAILYKFADLLNTMGMSERMFAQRIPKYIDQLQTARNPLFDTKF
jgi:hypothetical protein